MKEINNLKDIIDLLLEDPKQSILDFIGALSMFGSIMVLYFFLALIK